MKAVLQLLLLLTKRDLEGIFSVGMNNLFLCAIFLVQGSTARHVFLNSLPMQLLVLLPLFFAMSADALERVPKVREQLWPLGNWQRTLLQVASFMLNPAFWLIGVGLAIWGGAAAGAFYFTVAVAVQLTVCLAFFFRQHHAGVRPFQWVPRMPGDVGGLVQVEIRNILCTLDLYAALMLCLAGSAYRLFGKAPEVEAFPILALMVALALSTYAQQAFGLDGSAGIARYRILPIEGWRLILAKDAAYLLVTCVLVLPLGLVPGLTFSLIALSVGRYSSLRLPQPQRAWRFTRGDLRFGAAQIIFGGLAALASVRVSRWLLLVAIVVYLPSVFMGGTWWDKAK